MDAIQGFSILTDWITQSSIGFVFEYKIVSFISIIICTLIIGKVLQIIVETIVEKIAARTKTKVDDKIVAATKKPLLLLFLLIGFYLAFLPLQLSDVVMLYVQKIALSLFIVLLTYVFIRVTNILIDAWGKAWAAKTSSTLDDELLPIFHKSSKVVLSIIGLLILLGIWGIDVTGLLAGLGIAGIALGFAVKDSLANIFGGISLILDKAFKVGDKVMIESGEVGVIEDIGLRSTRLRTYDNEIVMLPNGQLANAKIHNYVQPDLKIRTKVNFGVAYGTSPDKVKKVVLKAVQGIKHVMKDPGPSVLFLEMSDSSLNFVCNLWVDKYTEAYSVKLEATDRIYKALNKAKIDIPFPTRTIYMKK